MVKAYVVFVSRKPGIYSSYAECLAHVNGFTSAIHCKFFSIEEAERAYDAFCKESEIYEKNRVYTCLNCGGPGELGIANTKSDMGQHYYRCLQSNCHTFTWANEIISPPTDGANTSSATHSSNTSFAPCSSTSVAPVKELQRVVREMDEIIMKLKTERDMYCDLLHNLSIEDPEC